MKSWRVCGVFLLGLCLVGGSFAFAESGAAQQGVKQEIKNLKFDEALLKKFLKVYKEYIERSKKCMEEENKDPRNMENCMAQLRQFLAKNGFKEEVFGALTLRLTVGYAMVKAESAGMDMTKMMQENPLSVNGQNPLSDDEIALLKKYKDEIDNVYR